MLHAHTPRIFHAPAHSCATSSPCAHAHTPLLEYAHVHIPDCLSPLSTYSCVHTSSILSCSRTQPPFLLCVHKRLCPQICPPSTFVHTSLQIHPCAHAQLPFLCVHIQSQPPTLICVHIQVHTLLWKIPQISPARNQPTSWRQLRFITCSPIRDSALKI